MLPPKTRERRPFSSKIHLMEVDWWVRRVFLLLFGLASQNCQGNVAGVQERCWLIFEMEKPGVIALTDPVC